MANQLRRCFLPVRFLALSLGLAFCLPACRHTVENPPGLDPSSVVLPTLDGGVYALSEGREDLLVVTFFATWCMPCLAEIPYLRTLNRRPGVRVVGISLDEGGPRVLEPFRRQFEVDYPILLSDLEMREGRSAFGLIPGIPATFILDHEREVFAALLGGIAPSTFDPLLEKAARK